MQPPAPLQPPALPRVTAGDRAGPLPCVVATTCGHGADSKGVVCFACRVFLPEDFRIYTVGRGGLAKSELAHVKVTVSCVLCPASQQELWTGSRRTVWSRVPSASSARYSPVLPNTVPAGVFSRHQALGHSSWGSSRGCACPCTCCVPVLCGDRDRSVGGCKVWCLQAPWVSGEKAPSP